MLASAYEGGGDSVPQCSGAVNLGDRLKGRGPAASLAVLAVALALAGCAGAGGPSGVITGEALEAPAAGGEAVVATQETPAAEPAATEASVGQAVPPAATAAAASAPAASAPATSPAAAETSSRTARDGSRAAPPAPPSGKPKELPYPSFGTPAQIGDKPVMSKEDTAKLQKDLETLAKEREAKALRELEADQ